MSGPQSTPSSRPDRWPDRWVVPAFPHEPPPGLGAEPELTTVDGALLTRVQRGELRTVRTPNRWLRGAVHDADGRLVVSSQKLGGLGGSPAAMADPLKVAPRGGARRLEGTWLYGGHWIQHFGHFFTETVTTLWPERDELPVPAAGLAGVVFHSYMSRFRGVEEWQLELLRLAGYGDVPVEIVEAEPLRVERLLVPGRSVVVNGWAHPGARRVWRRMTAAVDAPLEPVPHGERVFVSRTAFNERRRAAGRPVRTDAVRDRGLDAAFSDAGFRVVTPELLTVPDQVRLAAGASVLAGCAGTALHLSAFSPAGTRVLEIGDSRSPDAQVPQQQVIDHLCDHPSAFVPDALPSDALPGVLATLLD